MTAGAAAARWEVPGDGVDDDRWSRTVCVIGAGAAGLVTAKHLRASGFDPVIYESRDGIGGVWYFAADSVGVSKNTRATSSTAYLEFSDFPMPSGTEEFVPHATYRRYLLSFAEHHDLTARIHVDHQVLKVVRDGQAWRVTTSSPSGVQERRFRAVAVCSGLHHVPLPLEVPGEELFKGQILHSARLKNVADLRGKRVMVVGVGESGADMVHEVAAVASKCFLSIRRGVPVLARQSDAGRPADFDASRAKTWLPARYLHDYYKRSHQFSAFSLLYHLLELPILLVGALFNPGWFSEVRRHLRRLSRPSLWSSVLRSPERHGPPSGIELSRACRAICQDGSKTPHGRLRRAMALFRAFEWYSGTLHFAQPFTKSEEFLLDIADGAVTVLPGLVRFTGPHTVELQDGSTVEADCILLCTGFKTELPFLAEGTVDGRALFKGVFTPDQGDGLAFIGFSRPGIGALPPIAEMQARWFASVLSRDCRLPDASEMRRVIEADTGQYNAARPHHHQRLTSLVDYHLYMETLATYVGCRPRLLSLVRHPRLLWAVVCGPFTSHQFRLFGPGARPDVAIKRLTSADHLPPPGLWAVSHLLLFFVVRPLFYCLARLGFRRFRARY